MKRIGILLMLLVLFFSSCEKEKALTTNICVLIDITDEKFRDEKFVSENVPKLLQLMHLDEENGGFSGGEIKLSLINEISDSKSKTIKLKTAESGLRGENPLVRKDEVQKFCTDLESSFSQVLSSANWGTDASKIFQKVARELIKMKREPADRKYLIVYSDMLENSQLFTFYGTNWKTGIEKMTENPQETISRLSENGPVLPDLSEFEIYIIPHRTAENDEKINLSERFWTTIFKFRGATVSFNSMLEI